MSGFAPVAASGLAPEPDEVDWTAGLRDFLDRASFEGRWAVRLGLLMVVSAPFWRSARLRSGAALQPEERATLLAELLEHRFHAVRELALLLKLVACMTLFRTARLRRASGYDPERSKSELVSLSRKVA